MRDKNGYTLPEVLAVVTIIAVVATLTITLSVSLLDKTKNKINDYERTILVEIATTYAEDLDKNGKSYYLTSDMNQGSVVIPNGTEVKEYAFKELVHSNPTIPITINKLKELGYFGDLDVKIQKKYNFDCTINMNFETSVQDGYIVIDKISAKLGDDCK